MHVSSQDCDIHPYSPYNASSKFVCYVYLGGVPPEHNGYGSCSGDEVCTSLPQACPALATCRLSVKTTLTMPGDEAAWDVFAEDEFLGTGIGTSSGGDQCYPDPDSSGCTVYDVITRFGPTTLLDSACDASYSLGSGRVGSPDDHTLSCTVQLSVSPTHPLALTLTGPAVGIFAPGAGTLVLMPGAAAQAHSASAGKAPAPVFKARTIKVASARAVNFTPKLSAAAERSFKHHHKLAIRINMRFIPAGDGKTLTRAVTATLSPRVRRPPVCTAHKTRKSLLKCLLKGKGSR
jgi:hypothetical protein